MQDEYFTSRRLAPNVDFWSGLIYNSLGFPMDYYPVLFAVPRVVGWLAHWRQMMLGSGGVKIWRPLQVYVGAGKRDYVGISDRKEGKATLGSEPTEVSPSVQRSYQPNQADHCPCRYRTSSRSVLSLQSTMTSARCAPASFENEAQAACTVLLPCRMNGYVYNVRSGTLKLKNDITRAVSAASWLHSACHWSGPRPS